MLDYKSGTNRKKLVRKDLQRIFLLLFEICICNLKLSNWKLSEFFSIARFLKYYDLLLIVVNLKGEIYYF